MLIILKTRLHCPGEYLEGISRRTLKNKNFINSLTILIMKKLTFFTSIISIHFTIANQTPRTPNSGRGDTFERALPRSRRRRPIAPWEVAVKQPRKRPYPMSKRKIDKSKIPGILGDGFSGLKELKKVKRFLEHNMTDDDWNDVLPYDYIEDEAEKSLQTVEIPEEVVALDKEEAAKPKPEGRRKRGRVVGGTDVLSEEEFPFYASLRNSASANCGATILGKLPTVTLS